MWLEGKVRWFDNLRGEGIIRVGTKSFFVHWSALGPVERPKLVWYILFKNQPVKVQVVDDEFARHIRRVK